MDNAMADIQADDMKHGLYDTKISREELAVRIADRLLECTDSRDLEQFYWNAQYEWATDITDEELMQTANDLQVLDDDEQVDL